MSSWKDFPHRLRSKRERAGLTREQLAVKCGVSARVVAKYETESEIPTSGPDLGKVAQLADALGTTPAELLWGVGAEEALPEAVLAAIHEAKIPAPDTAETRFMLDRAAASTGWTPESYVTLLKQIRIGELAASQHFVDADVPRRVR